MNFLLETSRLTLKPISMQEIEIFHQIMIDPYVRKYLCDDKIFSLQQIKEMLEVSERLGYDYLVASADKPNLESHKLAKRLGMQQIVEKEINGNPTL